MRILVTGSAGFIGGHLVEELRAHGHTVRGVDLHDAEYRGDLELPQTFQTVMGDCSPDLVVHLAARVGRLFGEDDLRATIQANATMTTIVAAACGRTYVPLLYASTSEAYGDQGQADCHEDGPMVLPHNLYGLSKRWGEEACALYAPEGLKVCRFSMPYGPGVPPGRGRRAMDNMLWQAHHRMPIPVHRGAERSWCWIGDTVAAVRLIIEQGEPGAYNVGRDDVPLPLLDLAERACDLAGAPHDLIVETDPPEAQTLVKRLSTAKLRGLGWRPTVELDEGLPLVYEWVRRFDAEAKLAA